ncbi:MAG: hypothetical protein K2N01_04005 [Lachnospiraceae bacterium]|nr:hypothetical protein [Lachnospiraceae bacterium]
MLEISKSDWKLLRKRILLWQEHYMERLTKEYAELLTQTSNRIRHEQIEFPCY